MSDSKRNLWQRIKGPVIFAAISLAVIGGLLPRMPPSWGIYFGVPYLVFFSLAVLGIALFFVLLNWGPIPQPNSSLMTFASIVFVYVATVGGLVSPSGMSETPRLQAKERLAKWSPVLPHRQQHRES